MHNHLRKYSRIPPLLMVPPRFVNVMGSKSQTDQTDSIPAQSAKSVSYQLLMGAAVDDHVPISLEEGFVDAYMETTDDFASCDGRFFWRRSFCASAERIDVILLEGERESPRRIQGL